MRWIRTHKLLASGTAIAAMLVFFYVLGTVNPPAENEKAAAAPEATSRPPTIAAPTATAGPTLAILSANCLTDERIGFTTCEGSVMNLSTQPLENVQAVVRFGVGSDLVSSDTALIEYDPLLPGQSSPWKVIARYNPAFNKWGVEFAHLLGGTITSRYDYRTPTP